VIKFNDRQILTGWRVRVDRKSREVEGPEAVPLPREQLNLHAKMQSSMHFYCKNYLWSATWFKGA